MPDDRAVEDLVSAVARLRSELDDLRSTAMARAQTGMTGDIEPTIRGTPKAGTLLLQGQTVNRADYPVLWQWAQDQALVITGLFGAGNGSTTFVLPDMRGRVPIGVGTLGADTYALGDKAGAATVALTTAQLPAHSHTGTTTTDGSHSGHAAGGVHAAAGTFTSPDFGSSGSHNHDFTTANTGSGSAHENRPPYLAVNWLIWT